MFDSTRKQLTCAKMILLFNKGLKDEKIVPFDKDLYYKIYKPEDILKVTVEEYKKDNNEFYNYIRNTTIDDYKPGGDKRIDLCTTIPLVHEIAEMSGNDEFIKELNEYLTLINYDEKQVHDELLEKCNELLLR